MVCKVCCTLCELIAGLCFIELSFSKILLYLLQMVQLRRFGCCVAKSFIYLGSGMADLRLSTLWNQKSMFHIWAWETVAGSHFLVMMFMKFQMQLTLMHWFVYCTKWLHTSVNHMQWPNTTHPQSLLATQILYIISLHWDGLISHLTSTASFVHFLTFKLPMKNHVVTVEAFESSLWVIAKELKSHISECLTLVSKDSWFTMQNLSSVSNQILSVHDPLYKILH